MKIHELINENNTNEALAKAVLSGGVGVGKTLARSLGTGALKTLGLKNIANPTFGTGALKFFKVGNALLNLLTIFGIGKFVVEYYDKIEKGQKNVDSGKWTEEQFQDFRQGEMTKLVLEIASSTVMFSALKVVTGWTKWTYIFRMVPLPAVKAFGVFMNSISEAARVAFIAYLLSDKGKEAREAIGDLIGRGVVDNTLGGNGVALVDKVKHLFGLSQKDGEWKNPLSQTSPGTTDKETDSNTTTTNAKKADDDSSYDYDKSKYTRSADGGLVPKITIGN